MSAAARPDHGVAEPLGEQGAIGQAGQGAVGGQIAQFLFVALALGDVGEDADEVGALALGIADFGALQPGKELLAILAPLPEFAAPQTFAHDRITHVLVVLGRMLGTIE